jgi:hypothetical protein
MSIMKPVGATGAQYDASDGERVIFYLIGQTLLTRPNSSRATAQAWIRLFISASTMASPRFPSDRARMSFIQSPALPNMGHFIG